LHGSVVMNSMDSRFRGNDMTRGNGTYWIPAFAGMAQLFRIQLHNRIFKYTSPLLIVLAAALASCGKSPGASLPKPAPVALVVREGKSLLDWARLMVENVKPSEMSYEHDSRRIKWPEGGDSTYQSRTDCSGFVTALLRQTYGLKSRDIEKWLERDQPLAKDYYRVIKAQRGFMLVSTVSEIQPNDVIAIQYPTDEGDDDTGHIMIVAGTPQPREATPPRKRNTEQWDVPVIDQSRTGHGSKDTRHLRDGGFISGVGLGTMRLYTDQTGRVVGYAWSGFPNSDYHSQSRRPLVIGRIVESAR
jgi:hypothetical protein